MATYLVFDLDLYDTAEQALAARGTGPTWDGGRHVYSPVIIEKNVPDVDIVEAPDKETATEIIALRMVEKYSPDGFPPPPVSIFQASLKAESVWAYL